MLGYLHSRKIPGEYELAESQHTAYGISSSYAELVLQASSCPKEQPVTFIAPMT